MTYLNADTLPQQSAGRRFRALMDQPGILRLPGATMGRPPYRPAPPGLTGCISPVPQ